MKKPSKKKRTPPRRKPLKKRWVGVLEFKPPSQAEPPNQAESDRVEAYDRAMLEGMPPEVREEWNRLIKLPLSKLEPADQARLDGIVDQYETPVSEEEIARHVADIVREREAKETVPEP